MATFDPNELMIDIRFPQIKFILYWCKLFSLQIRVGEFFKHVNTRRTIEISFGIWICTWIILSAFGRPMLKAQKMVENNLENDRFFVSRDVATVRASAHSPHKSIRTRERVT